MIRMKELFFLEERKSSSKERKIKTRQKKEEIIKEIEHLRFIDLDLMYSLGNHWRWNNGKLY